MFQRSSIKHHFQLIHLIRTIISQPQYRIRAHKVLVQSQNSMVNIDHSPPWMGQAIVIFCTTIITTRSAAFSVQYQWPPLICAIQMPTMVNRRRKSSNHIKPRKIKRAKIANKEIIYRCQIPFTWSISNCCSHRWRRQRRAPMHRSAMKLITIKLYMIWR